MSKNKKNVDAKARLNFVLKRTMDEGVPYHGCITDCTVHLRALLYI